MLKERIKISYQKIIKWHRIDNLEIQIEESIQKKCKKIKEHGQIK
jgi:hypothetical protein